jgi:hypothetical protein
LNKIVYKEKNISEGVSYKENNAIILEDMTAAVMYPNLQNNVTHYVGDLMYMLMYHYENAGQKM